MPTFLSAAVVGSAWATHALAGVPAVWAVAGAGVGSAVTVMVGVRHTAAVAKGLLRERVDLNERISGWLRHYDALIEQIDKDVTLAAEQVGRGEAPTTEPGEPSERTGDPFGDLAAALETIRHQTLAAIADVASEAASHRAHRDQMEVYLNVARRLHALVRRALQKLSDLEREVEDPDLLLDLFTLDHQVTLIRRAAESLAVLGGEQARQVRDPLMLSTVLRQAVAEIEQYRRVRVVTPTTELRLPGHAGPDVIHLLAELIENAAEFSPPETQVIVRVQEVPAGLVVEVEDRGLSMPDGKLSRMNQLLAAPESVDVREQLAAGQIGLLVAARLAIQHGIGIELRRNLLGGTQAIVVLPHALLLTPEEAQATAVASPASPAPPAPPASTAPPADPKPAPTPCPPADPVQPSASSGPGAANRGGTQAQPLPQTPRAENAAEKTDRPKLPQRTRRQPLPADPSPSAPPPADVEPSAGLWAAFTGGQQEARTREPVAGALDDNATD
ncbi:hypothetical protein AQ490_06910 [Wenjunlia vitaminophila]|uniref:histidine kinase n=1 Tax=Wenjunlia vitaminophila TaxID=76728 RepID=A0A0T6LNE1_WENVI|nr:hypothetical protein AQ490_06910 [Wenjunlia vitaminophila]